MAGEVTPFKYAVTLLVTVLALFQDQIFRVPDRYTLQNCVGRGAFGIVCSALQSHDGSESKVAIKKVPIREDNILEVKRFDFDIIDLPLYSPPRQARARGIPVETLQP